VPFVNEKNFCKDPWAWWRGLQLMLGVMKFTHNVALSFLSIFIPLNQLFGTILDFRLWIADLLYRFALSFFKKLIRRRLTLNPKSKILNPKLRGIKAVEPIRVHYRKSWS